MSFSGLVKRSIIIGRAKGNTNIRWLVEVNDTARNVRLDVSLVRAATRGDGSKVTRANEDCKTITNEMLAKRDNLLQTAGRALALVIILEEQRPRASVKLGGHGLGLDGVFIIIGGRTWLAAIVLHDVHGHGF